MRYIWNGINTALLLIGFVYMGITNNINTQAYDKSMELEEKVTQQEKRLDDIHGFITQKDTVVVNIKNYNYYNK